jgi:(R)-2-hydroxyacyl-CoA dehydratese activating ATPase
VECFLGIDIGSTTTKGVLLDSNARLIAAKIIRTKPVHSTSLDIVYNALLEDAGEDVSIMYCIGTGYGRDNISCSDKVVTEISCHAKGAHYYFPAAKTVIDIGGQDAKIIRLSDTGNIIDFVLNEKCAAGTGRFLELAGRILKIPVTEFGIIANTDHKPSRISSTCAVFAQSEVISKISEGETVESVIKGLHQSVVSRVLGMGRRIGIELPVVLTGGVASNQGIWHELARQLESSEDQVLIHKDSQIMGALGAALLAQEAYNAERGLSESEEKISRGNRI